MNITSEVISRFWEKVNKTDSCWNWTAATYQGNGYGMFSIEHHPYKASRVSWVIHNGPIPDGLHVCHTCDNPSCVNPEHLWLGTHKENMQDKVNKGRSYIHGVGEESPRVVLTEEQVIRIRQLSETVSQRKLARMFNVGRTTIRHIQDGNTWKHLL